MFQWIKNLFYKTKCIAVVSIRSKYDGEQITIVYLLYTRGTKRFYEFFSPYKTLITKDDWSGYAQYIIPWMQGDDDSLTILKQLSMKVEHIEVRLLK